MEVSASIEDNADNSHEFAMGLSTNTRGIEEKSDIFQFLRKRKHYNPWVKMSVLKKVHGVAFRITFFQVRWGGKYSEVLEVLRKCSKVFQKCSKCSKSALAAPSPYKTRAKSANVLKRSVEGFGSTFVGDQKHFSLGAEHFCDFEMLKTRENVFSGSSKSTFPRAKHFFFK